MKYNHLIKYVIILYSILLFSFNANAELWACKAAKVKANKTTTGCLKVDELKREYRLQLPNKKSLKTSSLPLLIGLHGGGGKAKRFQRYADFNKASKSFIAVYPQGIKKHWNDGRSTVNAQIDDVEFLNQLVEHLSKKLSLPIDMNQIYIAGMSNGGLMALRMACEQPSWLSGVAVVAATMSPEIEAHCRAKTHLKPLKMVFVFGDKDTAFLTNGKQVNPVKPSQQRGHHIGIKKTVQFWKKVNRCSQQNLNSILNNDPQDKTSIVKNQYQGCEQAVVFYDVKNGGHRWPSPNSSNGKFLVKRLNVGIASQDMSAGKEIVKVFLKR